MTDPTEVLIGWPVRCMVAEGSCPIILCRLIRLYTKYHRQLRDKGALMKAHFHFIDAHRKEWLGKYKTFNEFYKRFEVTPDMLAQLVATGKEMGVEYNEEEYQRPCLC